MDNAFSEDNAARLADRTKAVGGAFVDNAKTQVKELAGQASTAAEQTYGQARDQVRDAATMVARSVENQPLIALLMAGFACGALGFLLARR